MTEALVTGELVLPAGVHIGAGAVAHVCLRDTSLADAPAALVDEQVIGDVATTLARGLTLCFVLRCPAPDPRASYSVSAHIDQDGDGRVSGGDLISVQSYPVITFNYPTQVAVQTVVVG